MKHIFDLTDRSDIPSDVYLRLPEIAGNSDEFGRRIKALFVEAQQEGLYELTAAEVTIAYYRKYTKPYQLDVKNKDQIACKLATMVRRTKSFGIFRIDPGVYSLLRRWTKPNKTNTL